MKVSLYELVVFGFQQVPGFLPDNPLKNAEMMLEDDYGMIDGIINNGPKEPTVAQLEQQARSGQPISLMDLAAAAHREDNRLQVFFDGKPDADTRAELKSSGFRWAPSVGAWQRQLTDNAIRAADRLECIKPLSGEKPSQLQKKPSILQTMREQGEKIQTEPEKKAPSGRDAER